MHYQGKIAENFIQRHFVSAAAKRRQRKIYAKNPQKLCENVSKVTWNVFQNVFIIRDVKNILNSYYYTRFR